MGAAICMKLSCLYMYAYVRMCVHTCAHAHVHGASPKHPDRVPPHPPTPTPRMGGTPEISQQSIKIEQIKIFEFCLKILDL